MAGFVIQRGVGDVAVHDLFRGRARGHARLGRDQVARDARAGGDGVQGEHQRGAVVTESALLQGH